MQEPNDYHGESPKPYAYNPFPQQTNHQFASAGSPWSNTACTTPTSTVQAKASRHDHSQTTPRGSYARPTDVYSSLPPVRVTAPVGSSNAAPPAGDSSGLTPLAAQLRLGGSEFSPVTLNNYQTSPISGVAQQYQNLYSAQHAQHAAGGYSYEAHRTSSTGPLGAGVAHMTTTQLVAPAMMPVSTTNFVAAAPPPSAPRVNPSWPYAPGIAVVEQPSPPTQAPQQQTVRRSYLAAAGSAPTTSHQQVQQQQQQQQQPTHKYSLRSLASNKQKAASSSSTAPITPDPQQTQVLPSKERPVCRRGLAPGTALRTFGHLLTSYEKSELISYPEIWFVGRASTPKIHGSVSNGAPNAGYDDAQGNYIATPGDHIAYRFEILGSLGRGSFGQVLRCLDHATGTTVALKIIRNKRRFQRQAQVEASILTTLCEADPADQQGIVRIIDSFSFRSHLCITFELLGQNLYEHIKQSNFAGMPVSTVKRVAAQVLKTLIYLRGFNIVHCDIKPENILLLHRGSSAVKLIDFGSSCYADQRVYTYIQSRFYRAPEVILGIDYGPPIDIWSLACVLAELLTGSPIFPGEDEAEQMACIVEVLGTPPAAVLARGSRSKLFFDLRTGISLPIKPNSQGKIHRNGSVSMSAALRGRGDALMLDFMKKCLQWDPDKRLTPQQALQHPWLAADAYLPPSGGHRQSVGPLGSAVASMRRY